MIFVSAPNVDRNPAKSLIERLKMKGFEVDHSPRNPSEGSDPRWDGWYDSGLRSSLDKVEVFVIVIDVAWDSSTWMAEESRQAMDAPGVRPVPHVFFWNPMSIEVQAASVLGYLREELPKDLDELVERMKAIKNV